MRFLAVLDGTRGDAERQARVLEGFLREGLTADLVGETVCFLRDGADAERLVGLAPTCGVRLVRLAAHQPDRVAGLLADLTREKEPALFLLAGGPTANEVVARLAHKTGGAALTDVLSASVEESHLNARRSVYSNHMIGHFELVASPWCLSVDVSWAEAGHVPSMEHEVLSQTEATESAGDRSFADVELADLPSAGELPESRFVVVAGRGSGDRTALERIAAAARRMGASFGVTRPVAMNGWAPVERLVGVSGVRIAPAVCLVVGASGAPAFLWGVEHAGVIVAVNPDQHAPIVKAADAVVLDDGVATIEALADLVAQRSVAD